MPLWNRSSSLASSGGITNRSGSNTEEIHKTESAPAQSSSSSSSSTGGWLSKAFNKVKDFVSNHAEGSGQTVGAVGDVISNVAGPKGRLAWGIAKKGLDTIGNHFEGSAFQKFTKGLNNKQVENTTNKAHEIYKNDKLNKVEKLEQFNNLLDNYNTEAKKNKPIVAKPTLSLVNPVSNVSNGHVPSGYQATSAPTSISSSSPEVKSVISTGSTGGLRKAIKNFNKKTKGKGKNKKGVWNELRKKAKAKQTKKGKKK